MSIHGEVEVRLFLSEAFAEALRQPGGVTHTGRLNLRLIEDDKGGNGSGHATLVMTLRGLERDDDE